MANALQTNLAHYLGLYARRERMIATPVELDEGDEQLAKDAHIEFVSGAIDTLERALIGSGFTPELLAKLRAE